MGRRAIVWHFVWRPASRDPRPRTAPLATVNARQRASLPPARPWRVRTPRASPYPVPPAAGSVQCESSSHNTACLKLYRKPTDESHDPQARYMVVDMAAARIPWRGRPAALRVLPTMDNGDQRSSHIDALADKLADSFCTRHNRRGSGNPFYGASTSSSGTQESSMRSALGAGQRRLQVPGLSKRSQVPRLRYRQ